MGGCCGAMKSSHKSMPAKDKQPRSKNNTLTRNNETKSKNDKKVETNGKTSCENQDATNKDVQQESNILPESVKNVKLINPFEVNDNTGDASLVNDSTKETTTLVEENIKVIETKDGDESDLITKAVLIVEETIRKSVQEECLSESLINKEIIQEVSQDIQSESVSEYKVAQNEFENVSESLKENLVTLPEIQLNEEVHATNLENPVQDSKFSGQQSEKSAPEKDLCLVHESKCLSDDFVVQGAEQEKIQNLETFDSHANQAVQVDEKKSEMLEVANEQVAPFEQINVGNLADNQKEVCLQHQSINEAVFTSGEKDEKSRVQEVPQEAQQEKLAESLEYKDKENRESNLEIIKVSEIGNNKCQEHKPVEAKDVLPEPMQCVLEESHLDETVTLDNVQECSFASNFETPTGCPSEPEQNVSNGQQDAEVPLPGTENQEQDSSAIDGQDEVKKTVISEPMQPAFNAEREDTIETAPKSSQVVKVVQQIQNEGILASTESLQSCAIENEEVIIENSQAIFESIDTNVPQTYNNITNEEHLEKPIETITNEQPMEMVITPETGIVNTQTESKTTDSFVESSENVDVLEPEPVGSVENVMTSELDAETHQNGTEIIHEQLEGPKEVTNCEVIPEQNETNDCKVVPEELVKQNETNDCEIISEQLEKPNETTDCEIISEQLEKPNETVYNEQPMEVIAISEKSIVNTQPESESTDSFVESSANVVVLEYEPITFTDSVANVDTVELDKETHTLFGETILSSSGHCQATHGTNESNIVLEREGSELVESTQYHAEDMTQNVEKYSSQLLQETVEIVLTELSPVSSEKESKNEEITIKSEAEIDALMPLQQESEAHDVQTEEEIHFKPTVEITLPSSQDVEPVDVTRLPSPPAPEELMFPQNDFRSEDSSPSSQDSLSLPSPPEDLQCQGGMNDAADSHMEDLKAPFVAQEHHNTPPADSSQVSNVKEIEVETQLHEIALAENHEFEEKKE